MLTLVVLRRSIRRAFTVPELLAVVAVIAIIISILLPAISKAREVAREVICKSNQRQIGLGFITFTTANKQRMPGLWVPPHSGPEPHMRSWMGNEAWSGVAYEGSIVQYIGGRESARKMYRCPSLANGVYLSGVGSNGKFDYVGVLSFSGARRSNVPSTSTWTDPATGAVTTAPTPLVVEEDPWNSLNKISVDPAHANTDEVGTWHNGGSNYVAFDGHSERIRPSGPKGPDTWKWKAKAPSGAIVTLDGFTAGYGSWDSR